MARYNPNLMQLDDGDTGAPRIAGPRTDTTQVTAEEVKASLDAAAATLGIDPQGAQFEETQIFSPVGGKPPVANASMADAEYFGRNGFTPGPLPEKYQKLFGNDPNIIGWKLITNPDGSQQIAVALPQGDVDGGLSFATYGTTFKTTSSGNIVPVDRIISTTDNPEDTGTSESIKALQAQIAALTSQITGNAAANNAAAEVVKYNERMSIYSSMADRFNKYGLTGLANKIKELAIQGATEATITLQLQETPEYQQRFAANTDRLKKGLAVLTPAEYVNVEDSYRQVLRAYGLKEFDNDAYVRQFIANDMSPTELSNRVVTAVQRVQNADPAIIKQLKDYYGITSDRLVAYVLDPEQQFQKIERQIAAAEIGVAAGRQGLTAGVSVADQLAAQGITEAQAQKGYATIADILPTAEKLSDIYGTTLDEYRQSEGEQEVFNQLASAQRKRQKLTARELAAFSGSSGTNKTSLTTSSVGQY
jgi:hypothetical protein